MSIAPEGISLAGTYPVMLKMRVPYTVAGDLAVEQQTQLMFRIHESGISGVNMPGGLNALLEKEINPVYDLAKFAARSKKDIERAKQKLDYDFMLNGGRAQARAGAYNRHRQRMKATSHADVAAAAAAPGGRLGALLAACCAALLCGCLQRADYELPVSTKAAGQSAGALGAGGQLRRAGRGGAAEQRSVAGALQARRVHRSRRPVRDQ